MSLRKSNQPLFAKTESRRASSPRRKRLLINPQFQAVFALYAIVTTLLMVPIFIAGNFYFFNLFSTKAHMLGLPPEHELLQFVDRQQTLMVVVFILGTFVAVSMNVVFSYMFSNRIAGSLYRLTTVMNQTMDVASANKIHSRKFDFFTDVYEAYNQLLDRLRS
ncbi:MAG: hypothetical protein ACXVA9_13470 [Bdellovibrionales bacterium]